MPPIGRFFRAACLPGAWLLSLALLVQPVMSPAHGAPLRQTGATLPPPTDPAPAAEAGPRLLLSTRKAVLTPNSAAQLTLTVTAGGAALDGATLGLDLPAELLGTAGNQPTEWQLADLAPGESRQVRVVVKAADDRALLPAAAQVAATLRDGDAVLLERTLYLGVTDRRSNQPDAAPATEQTARGSALENLYGDVSVIVPEDVAPPGTPFVYTPRYDWQEPPAGAARAGAGSNGPPPALLDDLLAYKQWRLATEFTDRSAPQLDAPLQVAVDAAPLIAQGVDPEALRVYAHDRNADRWYALPTTYDPVEQHFRAWVYQLVPDSGASAPTDAAVDAAARQSAALAASLELSLAASEALSVSGDILPSVSAFSVGDLSGTADIRIPIQAPTGLGGLRPNVAFRYSSATVDDMYNQGGQDQIEVQAGAVGMGWSLSGIPYIASQFRGTDGRYSLVLDGLSSTLLYNRNEWRTRPEQFARIEWEPHSVPGEGASGIGRWIVTDKAGVQYIFGDDDGSQWRTYGPSADTAIAVFRQRTDGGTDTRWYAKRWYLRRMVDPSGNVLEMRYRTERGTETRFSQDGESWYTSMISPREILWNRHSGSYRMRLAFSYATRYDTGIEGASSGDGIQPWVGRENKLTQAQVQVWERSAWRTIRSYVPVYYAQGTNGVTNQRLVLQRLAVRGARGGTLQQYRFDDYAFRGVNEVYINVAENGFGARTRYALRHSGVNCTAGETRANCWRARTVQSVTQDGVGGSVVVHYLYGNDGDSAQSAISDDGLFANEGGFLGYNQVKRIVHERDSCTVLDGSYTPADAAFNHSRDQNCRALQAVELHSGIGSNTGSESRSNPDQAAPRLHQRRILQPLVSSNGLVTGYAELGRTSYDWAVRWRKHDGGGAWSAPPDARNTWYEGNNNDYHYPPVWVYLHEETTVRDGAYNKSEYSYDGGLYGNLTRVRERGDGDAFLRDTVTEYAANPTAYIVGLPARVRVYDSSSHTASSCVSETRTVYGQNGYSYGVGDYTRPPALHLPARVDRARDACGGSWETTQQRYDGNGGLIQQTEYGSGATPHRVTSIAYDAGFGLFPRTRQVSGIGTVETREYYGVSGGPDLADADAFFGAPAQVCGMNELCTRYGYDEFGRPTRQWERVGRASSRSGDTDANAQIHWAYDAPGSLTDLSSYMVTEWRNPRSEGNFVRRHYNGLGQLVLEQTPFENWSTGGGNEVHVNYGYDGVGRQVRVSVPRKLGHKEWSTAVAWRATPHTETSYDALGRVTKRVAPNGQTIDYAYGVYAWSGAGRIRATSVMAQGLHDEAAKIVGWTAVDASGNLAQSRTYDRNGGGWREAARVELRHDAMGNLTQVVHADNRGSSTLRYDLLGNKTVMDDVDLGRWQYAYDRRGNLVRQVDARGRVICLYYDALDRLLYKDFPLQSNAACPASMTAGSANVVYVYGASGSAKGELTEVRYTDGAYRKQLSYDSRGRLAEERVTIAGAPDNPYVTRYRYDAYHRLTGLRYPDGEWVNTSYNGLGLADGLESEWSSNGRLQVTNVAYDEAGRLTQMKLGTGSGALYRTQSYWPWSGTSYKPNGNGLLDEIKVGTSGNATASSASNRLYLQYGYDSFGNVGGVTERANNGASANYAFAYDDQNRVTSAYGRAYSWRDSGNLASFGGDALGYGARPAHAVATVNGQERYAYDANGNMTQRTGSEGTQHLGWDHENRLSSVTTQFEETYSFSYAPDGARVKREREGETVYYINPYYEVVEIEPIPLAVRLTYFSAAREAGGPRVDFVWQTAQEGETAGFNLLAEGADGIETLNDALIPAAGLGDLTTRTYDYAVATEAETFYLEEVTLAGASKRHGPFALGEPYGSYTPADGATVFVYLPLVQGGAGAADAALRTSEAVVTVTYARKHYYFGDRRIALREEGETRFLHGDHLGSLRLETAAATGLSAGDGGYHAFGARRQGWLPSERRFTGQIEDGTGLYYYNARYYDPEIGQFLSPDTIVPDPTSVMDYNRYMYARGNPLRYSDPSGHCATRANGEPDENDAACWTLARTIANMWDDTDYWQNRFGEVTVWTDHIAQSGVDASFMAEELGMFLNSDAGQGWLNTSLSTIKDTSHDLDFGDFTAVSASAGAVQTSLLADDYGGVYIQFSVGLIGLGGSISRQDLFVENSFGNIMDIDEVSDLDSQRALLAADSLVGGSVDASIGFSFLGIEGGINVPFDSGGSLGAGANTSSGASFSMKGSYTIQVYPHIRIR